MKQDIRQERYQSARHVSTADGDSAGKCPLRLWFLKPELETHHKIGKILWASSERFDNGQALFAGQAIGLEYLDDLVLFVLEHLVDLVDLAFIFAVIVLDVRSPR